MRDRGADNKGRDKNEEDRREGSTPLLDQLALQLVPIADVPVWWVPSSFCLLHVDTAIHVDTPIGAGVGCWPQNWKIYPNCGRIHLAIFTKFPLFVGSFMSGHLLKLGWIRSGGFRVTGV